jgi:hypothetical protein
MSSAAPGALPGARHFNTRFKVDRRRQSEWLADPEVRECDVWPRPRRAPAEADARGGQPPPAAPAHQRSADCMTTPPPPQPPPRARACQPCGGGVPACPGSDGATAPHGTRVCACLAHQALEGQRGVPMHAAFEQTGGRAYLVLRAESGAAVAQMLLSGLELVDVGEGRVLIVPDLEPSELTMDAVGVLTLEDAKEFWDMVHRARRAMHRGMGGGKLPSPWAPSTSAPAHQRRVDSLRSLPAVPEVPRAEAAADWRRGR